MGDQATGSITWHKDCHFPRAVQCKNLGQHGCRAIQGRQGSSPAPTLPLGTRRRIGQDFITVMCARCRAPGARVGRQKKLGGAVTLSTVPHDRRVVTGRRREMEC